MSGYMIFVLVLTIAYIGYYAFVIIQDLRKTKGKENGNAAEQYSIDSAELTEDDAAIPVGESENGFFVGENHFENAPVAEESGESNSDEAISEAKAKMQAEVATIVNNMEAADVKSEMCLNDVEMAEVMTKKSSKDAAGIKLERQAI